MFPDGRGHGTTSDVALRLHLDGEIFIRQQFQIFTNSLNVATKAEEWQHCYETIGTPSAALAMNELYFVQLELM